MEEAYASLYSSRATHVHLQIRIHWCRPTHVICNTVDSQITFHCQHHHQLQGLGLVICSDLPISRTHHSTSSVTDHSLFSL
jgi:hypothetical protein